MSLYLVFVAIVAAQAQSYYPNSGYGTAGESGFEYPGTGYPGSDPAGYPAPSFPSFPAPDYPSFAIPYPEDVPVHHEQWMSGCQCMGFDPYHDFGGVSCILTFLHSAERYWSDDHGELISILVSAKHELRNFIDNHGFYMGHHEPNPPVPVGPSVRVVDGLYDTPGSLSGRVEVTRDGGRSYGTVCDDSWTTQNTLVVCRSLGYSNGVTLTLDEVADGSGTIGLDQVNCNGSERDILQCSANPWGVHDCRHYEDVGVRCFHGFTEPWPVVPTVRVVDGLYNAEDCLSGRVEVTRDGGISYGTVCDDGWTTQNTLVVCRALGYSNGVTLTLDEVADGSGTIGLDQVNCNANDRDILECSANPWGVHDCSHYEDVGVRCFHGSIDPCGTLEIRLGAVYSSYVGFYTESGRIEVRRPGDQEFGTVCDDFFGSEEASVACRMMGFASGEANHTVPGGSGNIVLDNLHCTGSETTLEQCPHNGWGEHNCVHSEDAGVNCWYETTPSYSTTTYQPNINSDIQIRLGGSFYLNSSTSQRGRLEVSRDGFTWGTVCDDSWSDLNAQVVCRQLRFDSGISLLHQDLGSAPPDIFMDNVVCAGHEMNVGACEYNGWNSHNCGHYEDVAVECYRGGNGFHVHLGSIYNGTGHNGVAYRQGRVEVSRGTGENSIRGTVCDDLWTETNSLVVCGQLGFTNGRSLLYHHYREEAPDAIYLDNVVCDEASALTATGYDLNMCSHNGWGQHNCGHSEDVGVTCWNGDTEPDTTPYVDIRLGSQIYDTDANGIEYISGRIEVSLRSDESNTWGTVCDDGWTDTNTQLACQQLGYSNGHTVRYATYAEEAPNPIFLDDVYCDDSALSQNEVNLGSCSNSGWGVHNCVHNEDIGATCWNGDEEIVFRQTYDVFIPDRMYDGDGNVYGRVEVSSINIQTGIAEQGTVCDDYWDDNDASVACRMMNYASGGRALYQWTGTPRISRGDGPIVMDNMRCTGSEESLSDCDGNEWAQHDCSHSEDAGILCYTGGFTTEAAFSFTEAPVDEPDTGLIGEGFNNEIPNGI